MTVFIGQAHWLGCPTASSTTFSAGCQAWMFGAAAGQKEHGWWCDIKNTSEARLGTELVRL